MRDATPITPLLASTAVSVAGDGAFLAAALLLAASLTRSPVAVATLTAASYLPWLLVGLPAGALVDRWSRRTVMVAAATTRAALLVMLTGFVAAGRISVALLALVVVSVGTA